MGATSKEAKSSLLSVTRILSLLLTAHLTVAAHHLTVHSPQDSLRNTPVNDSAAVEKKRYLSFSASYGNNSSFLGRYQSTVLPYLGADVTYLDKSGLWFSCMAYDIFGSTPVIDEVDLMAGWNVDFLKRWDASVYYARYFYNENTELLKAYVANSASASLGFDWSVLYSRLSTTYIFGDGINDVFLILDHSRYFEFPRILGSNDYISIDPQITLIAGTQTFYEEYLITEEIPGPDGKPVNPGKGKGKGKDKGKGKPGGGTQVTIGETEKRAFNMMSYEFALPVMYSTGRWSFETNGRYTIPVNVVEGYPVKPQFFFTSSLYYTISSKK